MRIFILFVAVLSVSTAAPLVYAAHPTPSLSVAAIRIATAAFLLSLLAGPGLSIWFRLPRRDQFLIGISGLLLAGHFAAWITSLYFTNTAASVALVATQPVFAVIIGHFFLGDKSTRRQQLGIFVAALGCLVLAGTDAFAGGRAIIGDMLALLGAALAACYLGVGRAMREKLPLIPYLAFVNIIAGIALVITTFLLGHPLSGFSTTVWLALLASALVPSIVGHTLLNWSVRKMPAHLVTLAILAEPVGASLLVWSFFGEQPPLYALLGGLIILVGIAVGFSGGGAEHCSTDAP